MYLYVSGPMTGHPNFNYDAFDAAAAQLRELGFRVFNPTEQFAGDQELSYDEYLRHDVKVLQLVTAVVMLPGWEKSAGARFEVALATALGAYCVSLDEALKWSPNSPLLPPRAFEPDREALSMLMSGLNPAGPESPLMEAHLLVNGDRQDDYGHPIDDFSKTALIWTAVLQDKLKPGEQVEAEDVPLCMVGVKLSRQVNRPKRDNIVDGQGYFETHHMVRQERIRRAAQGL